MDDELKAQVVDLLVMGAGIFITVLAGVLTQLSRKAIAWFDQQIQNTEQGKLEVLATHALEDVRRQSASDAPMRHSTKVLAVQQLMAQLAARKPKQKAAIELAVEQAALRQAERPAAVKQPSVEEERGLSTEQIAALVKLLAAHGVPMAVSGLDSAAHDQASSPEADHVHQD